MKKTNQATLLLVALLGLTACGGGSSSETQNDVKQEQASTQPQKKDITITGSVEKGPFVIGSTVTINILDENGENTDSTIVTKTTDDLGNFEFKVPEGSIIQITAAGYYRNEITGALSEGQLSLRSIYKATSDDTQSANVNLLTHLTSNRVLELIKAGETDFDKAISQAEEEFSANFQTVIARSNNESFSELSIYADANSDDNAYLLTLSSMLYQHAIDLAESNKSSAEAELTSILNELESDFGTDGKVENTDKLTAIQLTQKRIDPAKVTQHLVDWLGDNSQFTVPDINAYLDTDLDGIANNKDDDDDNDGIADEDDTSQFVADFVIDNQNISLAEDETVSVEIATNNPLGKDETIKFELISDVSSGSLNIDYPNISYTPVENYNGKDEFTFKLIQGNVESKLVTFSIDVTAVNDAPVISGTPLEAIRAEQFYQFKPLFSDIENDQLTFEVINLPNWLNLNSNTGELSGTPSNDDTGKFENIEIKVSDGDKSAQLPIFAIEVSYAKLPTPTNLSYATSNYDSKIKNVNLSWSSVDYAKSYQVQISRDEAFNDLIVNDNISELSNDVQLEVGSYYWRISTINPADEQGEWSANENLDVGVFNETFGKAGNNLVISSQKTADKGYLITSKTNLKEESGTPNSVISKFSKEGALEWEFITDAHESISLYKAKQLSSKMVVAVGEHKVKDKAYVLLLDEKGSKIREINYSLNEERKNNAFKDIIEVNDDIYLSYNSTCNSTCNSQSKGFSIHELVIDGNSISAPLSWTPPIGYDLISALNFYLSNNNSLIVSSTLVPTGASESDFASHSVFIQVLDNELTSQFLWNNAGNVGLTGIRSVSQLPNDNFILSGVSMYDGHNVHIISPNGDLLYVYSDIENFIGSNNIVVRENGDFSVLLGTYGEIILRTYSSSLEIIESIQLNDISSDALGADLFKNSDGTYTFVIEDKTEGRTYYDIVLRRKLIN